MSVSRQRQAHLDAAPGVSCVGLTVTSVVEFLWAKLPITLDVSSELRPGEVAQAALWGGGVGVLLQRSHWH